MSFFRKQKVKKALTIFETRIGGVLPSELTQILEAWDGVQVGPCRFVEAESLVALSARVHGWPADLIPVALTGPDSYCLQRLPDQPPSAWPIVLGLANPPNLVPIASTFRGFLLFLALQFEPSAGDGKEVERMKTLLTGMGIPAHLFDERVPPPKLPEEFAKYDKGALVPQVVDAVRAAATDLPAGAKRLLAVAKANPWWGAPYYILARFYRQIDHTANACGCYWNAIERAACYSGATSRAGFGDLGISQNCEADAVAYLRENEAALPPQVLAHFRWEWLREAHDLNDHRARMRIARHYVVHEQWERALWGFLDVLHAKWRDPLVANEVLQEMGAIYQRSGRSFEASVCEGGVVDVI
jgi:hypothetical protein